MKLPSHIKVDATIFLTHETGGMQIALKMGGINDLANFSTETAQKECLEKAIAAVEELTNEKGWRGMTDEEVNDYLKEKQEEAEEAERELMMRRLDDDE